MPETENMSTTELKLDAKKTFPTAAEAVVPARGGGYGHADRALRNTGISVVRNVPWGTHFSQFYRTKKDLLDVLVPYFIAGLENNELCVWVTSEFLTTEEAMGAMEAAVPNFLSYVKRGQIEIFPHTEWYLRGGKFEMKRVLADWAEKHDDALKKGYEGMRVSGNPFWLESEKDWDDFSAYEAQINNVVHDLKILVLCTYSLDKCGSKEIIDIISNHEFSLINRGDGWHSIAGVGNEPAQEQEKVMRPNRATEAVSDLLGISGRMQLVAGKWRQYALAFAIVLGATFLRWLLDPLLEYNIPYLTLYPAIMIVAVLTDIMPGIFAALAGILFAEAFFIQPIGTLSSTLSFVIRTGILLAATVYIGRIGRSLRAARVRAETEAAAARDAREKLQRVSDRERFLADTLENASLPFVVGVPDGSLITFNQAFAELTGYTKEELDEKRLNQIADLTPEEWREKEAAMLVEAQKNGRSVRYEKEYRRKDGSRVPVELLVQPIVDASGQLIHYRAFVSDVNKRKLAEEQVKKLSRAVEQSPASIVITDTLGKIQYVNPKFCQLTGYTFEEAVGNNPRILKSGHTKPEEYVELWKTITSGREWRGEFHNKKKNGELYWEDASISPIKDERGNVMNFLAVKEDITEWKRADEALARSVQRFELLSGTANSLLQTSDPQKEVESLCLKVMQYLDCQVFFNFIVDDSAGRLHLNACGGIPTEEVKKLQWLDFGVAICGCVARDGNRIVAENIPAMPDPRTELVKSYGVKAYACHPLFGEGGRVMGTLSFGTKNRSTFSGDDIALMKAVADQIATAMVRTHAESDLKKSEQFAAAQSAYLKTVLDNTPAIIWIAKDKECRVIVGNMASSELLRVPEGINVSKTGTGTEKLRHFRCFKDDRELPNEEMPLQKAAAMGTALHNYRFDIVFYDGSKRSLLGEVVPLKNFKGEANGAVAAFVDVTEKLRQESELKKLNRTLRALSNSNQALMKAEDETVFLQDACKIVVEDCGHAMVWIGYAQNDEVKTVRPMASAGFEEGYLEKADITWGDTDRGRGPTGTCIRSGAPYICRNVQTDPRFAPWCEDAIKRGYSSSIALPLIIESGKAFGALMIYSQEPDPFSEEEIKLLSELASDISYGVRMLRLRAAQRKSAEELRLREAQLKTVTDSTSTALAYYDSELRYVWVNPQYEHSICIPKERLIGAKRTVILHDSETEKAFRRVIETGEALQLKAEPDLFGHKEERGITYWDWTITPVKDSLGRVEGIVSSFVDVTEKKHEEEAKNNFIATIAHELRNPLAPIRARIDLLHLYNKDDGDTPRRRRIDPIINESIEIIERQSKNMARLLDDLLDISRIILGRIQLKKERVMLADTMHHALEAVRPLIDTQKHKLELSISDKSIMLEADSVRLEQIITNLLTNAAKYTKAGGRIWVSVLRDGKYAEIRIKDTGIGIAPGMLDKIFGLFTRSADSFVQTSTDLGIGLKVTRDLVAMHGGTIKANSGGLQHGSEFIVRLPAYDSGTQPSGMNKNTPMDSKSGRRILVVDDNVDAANALGRLLEFLGNNAIIANSGSQALETAERFNPELVLLDIGMPDMDGYEVCRKLREKDGYKAFIVAVTGYGQAEDIEKSKSAGFNRHLVKPVGAEALKKILAELP
jgi:PAS domain S-box-containing protein